MKERHKRQAFSGKGVVLIEKAALANFDPEDTTVWTVCPKSPINPSTNAELKERCERIQKKFVKIKIHFIHEEIS